MIARGVGSNWQTILADLSLILFMVTASALADTSDGPFTADANPPRAAPVAARPTFAPIAPAPRAEPVAVWRPAAGSPTLPQWLADVARDPRLRLTITVHYAPGGRVAALAEAVRLGRAAGTHGDAARIVIEPGQPAGINAVVGYDGAFDAAAASGTQFAFKAS